MDKEAVRADVVAFDALLDMVPHVYLIPADMQVQAPKDKHFDPRQPVSTSQRILTWLRSQSKGKKRKGGKNKPEQLSNKQLKEKLHARIGELKAKRQDEQSTRDTAAAEAARAISGKAPRSRKAVPADQRKGTKRPAPADDEEVDFGNITSSTRMAELTNAEIAGNAPGTKKRKLLQQIAVIDKERANLDALPADERKQAKRDAEMQKALGRASGDKVHDKSAKLKRALKDIQKKKSKSSEMWMGRDNAIQTGITERNEKRAENLKTKRSRGKDGGAWDGKEEEARQQKKQEKQEERNKKREDKKKQERAGFEGKKGFFNST